MSSIEKIRLIDRSELSGENYFQSLLEAAYSRGILQAADVERLQLECIELLAQKIKKYTGGESSSVRVEVAQSIMTSNLYTISLFLKSYLYPDEAAEALKVSSVKELYEQGCAVIEIKLKTAKRIHALILQNSPKFATRAYKTTIVGGMKSFFKSYNPEYAAHSTHISADYPTCNPVGNLTGVEFIHKYLESIYYENMFCANFASADTHHLLSGYDNNYRELIFNAYEQVITTAIACKLARLNAKSLNLPETAAEDLRVFLTAQTKPELAAAIKNAHDELKAELKITNIPMERYTDRSLPIIADSISGAIASKTLRQVLITPKYPELTPKLRVSFGRKMEYKQYRKFAEEVADCRYSSDRIAMLRREIQTLADLENILIDVELSPDELKAVLSDREPPELAAIAKRHLYEPSEEDEASDAERSFRRSFRQYLETLPQERQNAINRIIPTIEVIEERS
ncbi:MAG: DUF6179 domain-containing protein [Oscillospiraceae bacterium]|jgi:hypothetical protein|nr:DUF6179 domain-containing protein [Oscillospiraceae bacterium]